MSLWALLLVLGAGTGVTFAQSVGDGISGSQRATPPESRPRVSADELLQGRSATASIDELKQILVPGHEVVVWDATGRKIRGRLSSISEEQVVIYRPPARPLRLFTQPQDHAFPADSVTRIDIVDSTWNGALIGAAIAPALVFGIHRWEDAAVSDDASLKGIWTVVFGGISAVLAVVIGRHIDLSMNEPVYQRQNGIPRVIVVPWLEPTRSGFAAHVQF